MGRLTNLGLAAAQAEKCLCDGLRVKPFQIEGASWAAAGNVYLAYDVGLGKTVTALLAASLRSSCGVTAFVVPAHLIPNWAREMVKWGALCGLSVVVFRGVKNLRAERLVADPEPRLEPVGFDELPRDYWLLVAHETLGVWGGLIADSRDRGLVILPPRAEPELVFATLDAVQQPHTVIVDEAHRFADPRAARTGALLAIGMRASRVVLLSGTPLKVGRWGLWAALKLLQPSAWSSAHDFHRDYCAAQPGKHGGLVPGALEEVPAERQAYFQRFMDAFVLRYRRSQVARELPPHHKEPLLVEVSLAEAKRVGAALASVEKRLREPGADSADRAFLRGEVSKARVLIADLKHKAAVELVSDLVGEGERVLVWTWHRVTAARWEGERGLAVFKADGSLTEGARASAVRTWAETPGGVLVATFAAMGTGLDIMAEHCSIQVVQELPWDADELVQALGRLDRLSQKGERVLSYLLTLQVPFEQSLLARILRAAEETDDLAKDNRAGFVGELFGIKSGAYGLDDLLRGVA